MTKRIVAITLAILTGFYSAAISNVELGGQTFTYRPARRIGADVSFRGAARAFGTMRFVLRVGGVAFSAVASPSGPAPTSVNLTYDASAEDGRRVRVTLDGTDYDLEAPDWIAVPTARWAKQDTIELVTAFGELDEPLTRKERKCMFVFNYAAAFEDTLAGLRLMQADLIAMSDAYGDLFHDGGAYVLGQGETAPTATDVQRRALLRAKTFAKLAGHFKSYIFSDTGTDIEFATVDHRIAFRGGPTYRLWSNGADVLGDAGQKSVIEQIVAMSPAEMTTRARVLQASIIKGIRALKRTAADETRAVKEIKRLATEAASPRISPTARAVSLAKLTIASLSLEVVYLSDADNPLSDPATIASLNPEVYRAAESVSRLAAFYRYVRLQHPAAWKRFIRQIDKLPPTTPRVTLPTTMAKPSCGRGDHRPDESN